ncbi:uncharacterized protein [Nicotiana sylvestris]|uniref:uncharacterized protein n=1 Tax=Nicotiana sylvestris TaxID=4096 RepID=UPI00388C3B6F
MATPPNFEEGQSTYRPPKLNESIMDVGKPECMTSSWLKILSYEMSYVMDHRNAIEKNFRAKKILVCGIRPDEYNRISSCQLAKEIWEALQTAHEGTTQVKQSKIDMLTTECELFRMQDDESV